METGDLSLLDMKFPYLDGKDDTGWEHINTALTIATKVIGDRGLARIPANVGDWMDEFTKISVRDNAESQMLSAELCFLLKGFARIAAKYNHKEDSIKWMATYEKVKAAVNELAWDGDWYVTAFSDRKDPLVPVGSNKNHEGKIYLNAQSWPILAEIASPDKAKRSLMAVKKYLMSDYGPMIFSPSYTQYVDYIGTQSIYAPGFRNACIYLRPVGWIIVAACMIDQGGIANEVYDKASLTSRARDIENYHCEPYAYTENYNGPDHRLKGRGEFQWNLGEGAAWMWYSYVNYILGVRAELEGLRIDPKLPAGWDGYKMRRPFRGCIYDIEVKNPNKTGSGVNYIKIDGKKIRGSLITAFKDGGTHRVEVVLK